MGACASFNLDLRGFEVTCVTVDGRRARISRDGQELTVRPRHKLRRHERFTTEVSYSGEPEALIDADGFPYDFIPTDDGAFVANEPDGASSWYPVNDHPTDKATYAFTITVPRGYTAVANGLLPAAVVFDDLYSEPAGTDALWNPPPGDSGPDNLFETSVYLRGAMTVHVLRETVGDTDFFAIMREWVDKYGGGTATTPDFIRLAERISATTWTRCSRSGGTRRASPSCREPFVRGDAGPARPLKPWADRPTGHGDECNRVHQATAGPVRR